MHNKLACSLCTQANTFPFYMAYIAKRCLQQLAVVRQAQLLISHASLYDGGEADVPASDGQGVVTTAALHSDQSLHSSRRVCCGTSVLGTLQRQQQGVSMLLHALAVPLLPAQKPASLSAALLTCASCGTPDLVPHASDHTTHQYMHLERFRLPSVLCRIYGQFYQTLDSAEEKDEEGRLEQLWGLGEQYIASALQLCQSKDLQNIWEQQDRSFLEDKTGSHQLKLWVVPAVDEQCSEEVQEGRLYNVVPEDQIQGFVSSLQATATACCPHGITAQVWLVACSCIPSCTVACLCSKQAFLFGTFHHCLVKLQTMTGAVQRRPTVDQPTSSHHITTYKDQVCSGLSTHLPRGLAVG